MKKLLAVLMMTLFLGACGDSGTGVQAPSKRTGGGDISPTDTIPDRTHPVVYLYRPGDSVSITREAELVARPDVAAGIGRLESLGYIYDPNQTFVVGARGAEGHAAELTVFNLLGSGGASVGQVLRLRVGDQELVRAIHWRTDDPDHRTIETVATGKYGEGPHETWMGEWELLACLDQAFMRFTTCYFACAIPGPPSWACVSACWRQTFIGFFMCLFFTQM